MFIYWVEGCRELSRVPARDWGRRRDALLSDARILVSQQRADERGKEGESGKRRTGRGERVGLLLPAPNPAPPS